jgi:hypothetical protein
MRVVRLPNHPRAQDDLSRVGCRSRCKEHQSLAPGTHRLQQRHRALGYGLAVQLADVHREATRSQWKPHKADQGDRRAKTTQQT